ncbi:hypothetical protein IV78_GL000738 [Pediococcus acidilactici]|nr:hypothetical protein IV78_GL000738 [Pediococcus acidilactici]
MGNGRAKAIETGSVTQLPPANQIKALIAKNTINALILTILCSMDQTSSSRQSSPVNQIWASIA